LPLRRPRPRNIVLHGKVCVSETTEQRTDFAQGQLPRQLTTVRGERRTQRSCPISCVTRVIRNASRRGANREGRRREGRRRFKRKSRRQEPIWLMPGMVKDTREWRRRVRVPASSEVGGTDNERSRRRANHNLNRLHNIRLRTRPGEAGRRSKVRTPRTRRELSPGRRQRDIWIQRAVLRPNLRSTGRGSNPLSLEKRSRCERAWLRHTRCLTEEP
jgi:hypothetical protein